jgi:hypothetical protein
MKSFFLSLFLVTFTTSITAQKTATIFEPKKISNNGVFGLTISPDGNEAFWVNSRGGRDSLTIMQSHKLNGQWQSGTVASFSTNKGWKDIDPMFSPDGKTILFQSNRPVEGKPDRKGFDIWAVKKVKNGWGEPYHLGNDINTDVSESFTSMTKKGDIYFTKENPDGTSKMDLYVSRYSDGKYQTPINVGLPINTTERESNPFIDKNEKYLIYFSTNPEGSGDVDLYISFNEKGTWSKPINLGDVINSKVGEFCPFVHEKEKKLYFSRTEELPNKKRKENLYSIDFDVNKYKSAN